MPWPAGFRIWRNLWHIWRYGIVHFEDQPLGSVITEMRRYNGLNVHLADERLASIRVTADIPTDDAAAYIRSLERLEGVRVDRADSSWVVLRRQGRN